jgi:aryl-alcohol dehydrogenase-like predicted oxidoreductase
LAWVLAQGEDVVAIPGTRRSERLDENAAAVEVSLSRGELTEIDAVSPLDLVAGTRYPEGMMSLLDG